MKTNLDNLSDGQVSELMLLLTDIDYLINRTFAHISDNVNPALINSLKREIARVDKEYEKRDM